eukprot:6200422-Pleurochrysis_carterae.AAC.4
MWGMPVSVVTRMRSGSTLPAVLLGVLEVSEEDEVVAVERAHVGAGGARRAGERAAARRVGGVRQVGARAHLEARRHAADAAPAEDARGDHTVDHGVVTVQDVVDGRLQEQPHWGVGKGIGGGVGGGGIGGGGAGGGGGGIEKGSGWGWGSCLRYGSRQVLGSGIGCMSGRESLLQARDDITSCICCAKVKGGVARGPRLRQEDGLGRDERGGGDSGRPADEQRHVAEGLVLGDDEVLGLRRALVLRRLAHVVAWRVRIDCHLDRAGSNKVEADILA